MPTVSVIVPNYNHAGYLKRRVDSILGQTFQDFEVIVLDDCSTDESRSILQGYASEARVRLEFNEVNSGSAFKQWNKGLRLAYGKYVWIAESDDYARPDFLARLVPILQSDPSVTLAYCRSLCVSASDAVLGFADSIYFQRFDTGRWGHDFCVDGSDECRKSLIRYNTIPNASAVLFRKETGERVGGADETMRLCGDWKLWSAIALEGKVAYISEPLNYYRVHETSITRTVDFAKVHVQEWLRITRWMLERVKPQQDVLESVLDNHAHRWVPAVLSMRVPLQTKVEILRLVRAIDPHPMRRVLRPIVNTVRLKIKRHAGVTNARRPSRAIKQEPRNFA